LQLIYFTAHSYWAIEDLTVINKLCGTEMDDG